MTILSENFCNLRMFDAAMTVEIRLNKVLALAREVFNARFSRNRFGVLPLAVVPGREAVYLSNNCSAVMLYIQVISALASLLIYIMLLLYVAREQGIFLRPKFC